MIYLFTYGLIGSLLLCVAHLQLQSVRLLSVVVRHLLTSVVSLVVEHGLQACDLQ